MAGGGPDIDFEQPFLLSVFHPTTTEFGDEWTQIRELLQALNRVRTQTVVFWPNIDAGSDHISKAIRMFRDKENPPFRFVINVEPAEYLALLGSTACAVGNSSSFVRDAGYFGTPVVLVGRRQEGRESDEHVERVPAEAAAIEDCIRRQLAHGVTSRARCTGTVACRDA